MLTFESVKERLKREQSLSFLEFNYMVLQSYDFYYLNKNHNCSLQIGGSDQWGNIVLGIELISKISKKDSYGLTTPLLTTSSGKKMGKTEKGAVWIDKEKFNSFDFFQYWRNVDDKDVEKLLLIFSDLDKEEITSLIQEDINKAKKKLALVVTTDCHTKEDALAAEQKATDLFENKNFDQDVDLIQINNDMSLKLTDILAINNLIPSKSEAKRMIENNGIKINDIAIDDINHEITDKDEGSILKIGKKRIFKISFKN